MSDNPAISLFQAGTLNIDNPLQNQEEAEDLEEQIKRQEEIQNLLTVAMDEFNYDESTLNSSGNGSVVEDQNLAQKYKSSSIDDQLKILYEVRVREVSNLTKELERIKSDMTKQKDEFLRKYMLLEADKDKHKISLEQAQSLLASKNDEIFKLQNNLSKHIDTSNDLQEKIQKLTDENATAKHINKDLLDQLTIMKNGFTTNTITDKQIVEQQRAEISQLHISLDTALARLDRKEKECKDMEEKLKVKIHEKDDLMLEKSSVINRLTDHLEGAQNQIQELLQAVEQLSIENQKLKKSNLSTASFKAMTEQNELMKSLQKELEKSKAVNAKHLSDFENLQTTYSELHKKYTQCQAELTKYKQDEHIVLSTKTELEERIKEQAIEIENLRKINEHNKKLEQEKKELENQIQVIETNLKLNTKTTSENAVQVSQIFNTSNNSILKDKEAREAMERELHTACENVESLKRELEQCQEKISLKLLLEEQREKLIDKLREKAAQFEKIIMEKQRKPELVSVATNTVAVKDKKELLEAKYAAEIIEKEICIRENLKQEFDEKVLKLKHEYDEKLSKVIKNIEENVKPSTSKVDNCEQCYKLSSQLKQFEVLLSDQTNEVKILKEQRDEDHSVVAQLLDEWKHKFNELEFQNQELAVRYNQAKAHYDELVRKMRERDKEEAKLYAAIKKETEDAVKLWNRKTKEGILNFAIMQHDRINEAQRRIEEISRSTERRIHVIEEQHRENLQSLEH